MKKNNYELILIYIPCKNPAEAEKITLNLLDKKLAICANIIPFVKSYYLWKNKTEKAEETLLLVKTLAFKQKEAFEEIKKTHSYSAPTIFSLKTDLVSDDTLDWFKSEL